MFNAFYAMAFSSGGGRKTSTREPTVASAGESIRSSPTFVAAQAEEVLIRAGASNFGKSRELE
jgi:hypothetical protein